MTAQALQREAFGGQGAEARNLLAVLLAQDGSTTRVCEAIAGGPIQLLVEHQRLTDDVPAEVRLELPGRQFIERYSTLAAHGQAMMDNLTFVAVEGLAPAMRAGLESGSIPIGHLLEGTWARRRRLAAAAGAPLLQRLWARFGVPDPAAARAYVIETPAGALFLIAEVYRAGMRQRSAQAGREAA